MRASLYRPCAAECVRGDVLQDLSPGREIRVECLGTVLSGCPECRFRVEVGQDDRGCLVCGGLLPETRVPAPG